MVKTYVMKEKKPFYKRAWFWILIIVLVIGGIGNLASSKKENADINKSDNAKTKINPKEVEEKENNKPAENNVPTEYKSALKKAESYANSMNMSKAGIYDQLTSEYGEKFTPEEAEYAIQNLNQ